MNPYKTVTIIIGKEQTRTQHPNTVSDSTAILSALTALKDSSCYPKSEPESGEGKAARVYFLLGKKSHFKVGTAIVRDYK